MPVPLEIGRHAPVAAATRLALAHEREVAVPDL